MWWIIITIVVVGIGFVAVRKGNDKGRSSNNNSTPQPPLYYKDEQGRIHWNTDVINRLSKDEIELLRFSTNATNGNRLLTSNMQSNNGIQQPVDIYKEITGYDKSIIEGFRNIPIKDNYEDIDEKSGYTEIDVLIIFLFPRIYLAYLKYESFRISADDLEKYIKRLHINIQRFMSKKSNGLISDKDTITRVVNNYIIPAANNCMHKECKQRLFTQITVNDMAKEKGVVLNPKSEIEKMEYSLVENKQQMEKTDFSWCIFWMSNYKAIYDQIPDKTNIEWLPSENLKRMFEVKLNICSQIEDIVRFNKSLQKTLNVCEEKANKVIIVTYGQLLLNSGINKKQYYKKYDKIKQTCSSQLSPIVVASCDATLKKVDAIIKQKQEMLDKNNADIDKYSEMLHKIETQMDEERQLQEIKKLNKDIGQFDSETDLVKNEEKNLEFENMIEDINRMEIEVNERRDFEIQFGEIEI